jgi:hypothetical protein
MFKTATLFIFLESLLASPSAPMALAADDDHELPSVELLSLQPEVFLVPDQRSKDCPRLGRVCVFGNGGGTVVGIDVNPTVGIVTTLARGTQVAAMQGARAMAEGDDWHVEMIARFSVRTASEPIIVAVMDYADPEGMVRKEATAVWQVDGPPTKSLGLRLVFSAEEGFEPRHTYLVRIVQGTGSAEKILAEGNVLLE